MLDQQLHEASGDDVASRGAGEWRPRSWADHAAEAEAWEREHTQEWVRVDEQLRGIAARRAALDVEEARLLRYAEELKLWRGYACGSMIEYLERAMGYAPHTAAERLRVARALAELPLIAEALENGELAHSAVRELSRVAVPATEDAWLESARGKNLRQIEAMVAGHKPGDLPTDKTEPRWHRRTLRLDVLPESYDLWRRMHALAAEEHGQRLSDDELIASIFRRAYGDGGEGGVGAGGATDARGGAGGADGGAKGAGSPAYKIAIKQCPDCKRSWQYSGGRDIEVHPAVAECAACDAIHLGSLDAATPARTTMTVTPRKREQVLARDGYCCVVPGCRRNVGLDLHHIEYQHRGGGHELSNIVTACDLHHRAVHYGKLVIRGSAPDHLMFEFRKPRKRRNVTDLHAPGVAAAASAATAAAAAATAAAPAATAAASAVTAAAPAVTAAAAAATAAAPASGSASASAAAMQRETGLVAPCSPDHAASSSSEIGASTERSHMGAEPSGTSPDVDLLAADLVGEPRLAERAEEMESSPPGGPPPS